MLPRGHSSAVPCRLLALAAVSIALLCTSCGRFEATPDEGPDAAQAKTAARHDASLKDLLSVDSGESGRSAVRPRFRDMAAASGIRFQRFSDVVPGRFFLPEVMGGGAAWLDYDGDGRLDLYVIDGCRLWEPDPHQTGHVNRMFRNRGGGRFEEVAFASNSAENRYGQGCAVGDFNADGFPDLYLTNYGRNTLLVNNGDGTFDDATEAAGVGDELWGSSAAWLDVDGDGYLDLYVVNYVDCTRANHKICEYDGKPGYCGPGSWQGVEDRVFRSRGDGTFVESARALGFESKGGKGLAVVACDFDGDLKPEIYVANDMMPNFLFTRSKSQGAPAAGSRLYHDVAAAAGCATSYDGRFEASMGIACADFDGDGRPDIFLTHFYSAKNTLYRNLGGLLFDDVSRRSRIAATSYQTLGFGTAAFDFDRDGDFDLFVANGHVLGPSHDPSQMPPQLLENDGRGRFREVSSAAGAYFAGKYLGRGVAEADYDDDGDVDLAVTHVDRPLALLRNETRAGEAAFIGFDLRTPGRIRPIGGRVIVRAGSRTITLPVTAGGSYLSSRDPRLFVGLGAHRGPVSVEIHWPSGRVDRFDPVEVNRYWSAMEGAPRLR